MRLLDLIIKKEKQYYYIFVKYDDFESYKSYCYISEDPNLKVGDKVQVDMAGMKVVGTIVRTGYYTENNAPYPVNMTKIVISSYYIDEEPPVIIFKGNDQPKRGVIKYL